MPIAGIPTLLVAARSQRLIEDAYQDTAQDDRRALHLFDLASASSTAKELRVFGLQESIGDRYHQTWTEVDRRRNAAWMRANLVRGGASLFFAGSFIAAMALAVYEASRGRATPGDVLMTVSLAMTVNGSVEGTAQTVSSALNVGRSMARYLWLVDHAAEVRKATSPRSRGARCPSASARAFAWRTSGSPIPRAPHRSSPVSTCSCRRARRSLWSA